MTSNSQDSLPTPDPSSDGHEQAADELTRAREDAETQGGDEVQADAVEPAAEKQLGTVEGAMEVDEAQEKVRTALKKSKG